MKAKNCLSGLGSALFLSLTLAAPANADACSYRMGPFLTQDAAQAAAQQARYLGFEASSVCMGAGRPLFDPVPQRHRQRPVIDLV